MYYYSLHTLTNIKHKVICCTFQKLQQIASEATCASLSSSYAHFSCEVGTIVLTNSLGQLKLYPLTCASCKQCVMCPTTQYSLTFFILKENLNPMNMDLLIHCDDKASHSSILMFF